MNLQGKRILVTGGARGLGRAIAARCLKEGASVLIMDVLEAEGEATAASLAKTRGDIAFMKCDITAEDQLRSLAAAIDTRWSRLDGLVNNAALATKLGGKTFEEIDVETWDRVFEINVKGTWMVTRAMAPLLKEAANARIVNMSSDTALWGADLFLHYVASKGAIVAMTRALARELGGQGITVNAVAPGLTETEATGAAAARRWKQYEQSQLLPRRSQPDDIASVVAFLLSDDAAHISGQTFAVNGGMTLS